MVFMFDTAKRIKNENIYPSRQSFLLGSKPFGSYERDQHGIRRNECVAKRFQLEY